MKRASAVDLVDKPVVCPTCGDPAMLRRDDQGYWLDCQASHRPVVNILAETLLEVVEKDETHERTATQADLHAGRPAE